MYSKSRTSISRNFEEFLKKEKQGGISTRVQYEYAGSTPIAMYAMESLKGVTKNKKLGQKSWNWNEKMRIMQNSSTGMTLVHPLCPLHPLHPLCHLCHLPLCHLFSLFCFLFSVTHYYCNTWKLINHVRYWSKCCNF